MFQTHANTQGAAHDAMCRTLLADFDPSPAFVVADIGIEVDASIGDLWIEFKGSVRGDRPGLRRTDTLKKAICSGALASTVHDGPFVIITTHLPAGGSQGERMLDAACIAGWIDDVFVIGDPTDTRRLLALAKEHFA